MGRKYSKNTVLVPIMNKLQKAVFWLFVAVWAASIVYFWQWWLGLYELLPGYLISTAILGWMYLMPVYFLYFASRMKQPNSKLRLPTDWRVAMVVTKAPSEPWSMVQKTLQSMISQNYKHDTWLADEQPSEETVQWCQNNGVFLSSRHGVEEYHNDAWPRRTKSKEGNLAYFYDHFGYEKYDFVVQLDADHVPTRWYLERMLRPFLDDAVGYVSAPSICDTNASQSWSARARLYGESTMHGILQAGYTDGWAPLCIGSHYAIRTKALEEIGGLGPELAEDHSTTLLMNGHGWRGAHAFEAEAHGDGPATFADFMTQEFQWSRSLMILLFTLTPKYLRHLPFKLTFQFLFSQMWYPIFASLMLLGFLLPLWALAIGKPIVNVGYLDFVMHSVPTTLVLLLLLVWMKAQGWLRAKESKVISWEVFVFQLVRWPWIIWGFVAALIGIIGKKQVVFKVTPKGEIEFEPVSIRVLAPYLLMIVIFAGALFIIDEPGNAQGYYYFTLINLVSYSFVVLAIVIKHVQETYYAKQKSRN